ncbi:MAG: RdgB/HAM1 family non-canonical purine NTP pyrophosphatase [Saprospiraceae bacterium]
MKNKLIFATGNPNKVRETGQILKDYMEVISMKDIGATEDIPETMPTLEGCALQKARYLVTNYQVNCFSEDTGLEVDALDGAPGVITARYAGPAKDADANMALLLKNLGDNANRGAQFRTIIALILDGEEHLFEGIVRGTIAHQKMGTGGFGYDPVFIPEGHEATFANLSSEIKHGISHRSRALAKLVAFLETKK